MDMIFVIREISLASIAVLKALANIFHPFIQAGFIMNIID